MTPSEATPTHHTTHALFALAELLGLLDAWRLTLITSEPASVHAWYDANTAQAIATEIGAERLDSDPPDSHWWIATRDGVKVYIHGDGYLASDVPDALVADVLTAPAPQAAVTVAEWPTTAPTARGHGHVYVPPAQPDRGDYDYPGWDR